MSLNFKQWKKIIYEVVFLATLKEKKKKKKHKAISFNGFKLYTVNKNNHKQS